MGSYQNIFRSGSLDKTAFGGYDYIYITVDCHMVAGLYGSSFDKSKAHPFSCGKPPGRQYRSRRHESLFQSGRWWCTRSCRKSGSCCRLCPRRWQRVERCRAELCAETAHKFVGFIEIFNCAPWGRHTTVQTHVASGAGLYVYKGI